MDESSHTPQSKKDVYSYKDDGDLGTQQQGMEMLLRNPDTAEQGPQLTPAVGESTELTGSDIWIYHRRLPAVVRANLY